MIITEDNIFSLASYGEVGVLNHPSVDKVKNDYGYTPLHILALRGGLKARDSIRQKYSWFDFPDETVVTTDTITNILNTPKSIQFVKNLGDGE